MFNPNFEIFDKEYTKKIKLIAKIDTVFLDDLTKLYFIHSHGTNYVLKLSSKTNVVGEQISNVIIETKNDFYEVVKELNKNVSLFYVPENKELILNEKTDKEIIFNTLKISHIKNYSHIDEKQKFNQISYIDFMTLLGKEVKDDIEEDIDYINLFLKNTKQKNSFGMMETRPRFVFADGTSISIQASHFNYCSPRMDDAVIYERVECGFPSKKIDKLCEYAEDDIWTETVYPFVPVSLLNEIIKEKGIDKNFARKYLNNEIER